MAPAAATSHRATRPHPTLTGIGPRAVAGVQPLHMPFAIGEILAERKSYQVMSLIGAGERTLVVEALDREGARVVALKCLRPEIAADAEAAERFLERARANLVLDCDHVARVHEIGRLADGSPFLAMDRLRGCDLRSLLGDAGALLIKRACALALQMCEGLAAGHAAGVLHRGLKPENVVVSREGAGERLELLEFGTSCQDLGEPGSALRSAGRARNYRSPEQRSGRELDERSDIWSLGCLLYEMSCGRAPQFGVRRGRDGAKHEAPIVPLRSLRPELPAELVAVITRCLAQAPEQRFQDVAELARALVPFAPPAAHAHAGRCAELLGREPERASGVRRVLRAPDLLLPPPSPRVPDEPPRGSWRGPLALVLCVPLVSALGWLYATRPDVSLPAAMSLLRARLGALVEAPSTAPSGFAPLRTNVSSPAQSALGVSAAAPRVELDQPAHVERPTEAGQVVPIVTPLQLPQPAPSGMPPGLGVAARPERAMAGAARGARTRLAAGSRRAAGLHGAPAQQPLPLHPFKPDPYAPAGGVAGPTTAPERAPPAATRVALEETPTASAAGADPAAGPLR
jgi:serine/threonine protein kinase